MERVHHILGLDTFFIINIGLALAGLATWLRSVWNLVHRYADTCLATVYINEHDPLYHDVIQWMNDHIFHHRNFRCVLAVTDNHHRPGKRPGLFSAAASPVGSPEPNPPQTLGKHAFQLKPFNGSRLFTFEGRWVLFSHSAPNRTVTALQDGGEERIHLKLQTLSLSLDPLRALIEEASAYSKKLAKSNISVHRAMSNVRDLVRWSRITTRPSRAISTVILDSRMKKAVLDDMSEYLREDTRQWYANHGIPYRRGYLFSGPPGTGKTSLSSAIAGVFGLDIYVLSLLDPNISESQFLRLFSEVPTQCVVLLEDIDAAGMTLKRANVDATTEDATTALDATRKRTKPGAPVPTSAPGPISLSALLNAIDGVSSQEGRILIMTTNAPQDLDPALIRPGRVDMHIRFELPSREEFRELFRSMFSDVPSGPDLEEKGESKIESDVQKVKDADKVDTDMINLDRLAVRFSEVLPEGRFSLAEVQGFLLQYKRQPEEACARAAEWASANSH
ncbi:P-loop containing nucleoside triphosphate hydrolase protein [Aspergillus recurvatus]